MRSIELFAGAGGMALGVERAGFDVAAAVEINADCRSTLARNRPAWHQIPDVHGAKYPDADLITGGFPCQPFSSIGARGGMDDARGTLFYEFARAVHDVRPRAFIAENVPGLKTIDDGATLSAMIRILRDMKYAVQYSIVDAADYGVPQHRRRLFIIGYRDNLGINNILVPPGHPRVPLREALRDVPPSPGYQYAPKYAEIYRHVPPGGNWRDLPPGVARAFTAGMSDEGGKTGVARRLAWDAVSPTITTAPRGKLNVAIHPDEVRPLTVRESARVQGFPDGWTFAGSIRSQYRQVGNAVPPPLAEGIARRMMDHLGGGAA